MTANDYRNILLNDRHQLSDGDFLNTLDFYSKLKSEEENRKCVLRLSIIENYLHIGDDNADIGHIDTDNEMYMLSSAARIKYYEEWRSNGMNIDSTEVVWRGGTYKLLKGNQVFLSRTDIHSGAKIYSLSECTAIKGCMDENIKRFKHNNRPIIF